MRAARFYNKGDIRVEDVALPELRRGQALVDVEWCGICGSDLHEFILGPIGFPTPEHPHPLTGGFLPVIMGHELCGRIKAVGPDSTFTAGQAVMVDPRLCCRSCRTCKTSQDHVCQHLGFMGFSGGNFGGGFSEVVAVAEHMLYSLPENVPLSTAALIEPLAVAHHAVKASGFNDFSKLDVLIIGGGPIGYAVILALKALGAKSIFLSEPTLARREQISRIVERVIDPTKDKIGDTCRALTGGKGVDIAFDCAGVPVGMADAFDALTHCGVFINVSVWEKPMVIPFRDFLLKEISIKPSMAYSDEDFREVMELMAQGKFVGYEKMITSRISLEDVVEKGFAELVDRKDNQIKVLVTPKPELLK